MSRAIVIDETEWQSLKDTVEFLGNEVRELRARPAADAIAPMRPRELAKRYHVAHQLVYDALDSGRLAGTKRPGRGGTEQWLIEPKDAHAWWQRFIRGTSNQ